MEEQSIIDAIEQHHNELIKLEKKVEQEKSIINQLEFQLRQMLIS